MVITQQEFLNNTQQYLTPSVNKKSVAINTEHGRYFLLTAEEYEHLDTIRCIQQGKADIAAGRTTPHDQVFAELRQMAKDFRKNGAV